MRGESWMDIRSDRQKGMSYVELGKKDIHGLYL